MGNTEELIELNNKYREQLNEENQEFYDDILVYIRAKSFFKDEQQIEESLLEILTDIIEVQNKGVKANDYFGKNPKEISDDILKNINNISFKGMINLFFASMGLYTLVTLLPELINPSKGVDIGKFLIGLVSTFLFAGVVMNIVGRTVYSDKSKRIMFGVFVLFCSYIMLIACMDRLLPPTIEVKLTGVVGIIVISILGILGTVYSLKQELFNAFLPVILSTCTLGILSRLQFIKFSVNEQPGKTVVVVVMTSAMILFYLITYLQYRNTKKSNL